MLHRRVFVLIAALCLSCLPLNAATPSTFWQHDSATTGGFSDPANWTAGLPTADIFAYVQNGGTAVISVDSAARLLTVGQSAIGHVIQQSGVFSGSLTVGPYGTYVMNRGGVQGDGYGVSTGGYMQIFGGSITGSDATIEGTIDLKGGALNCIVPTSSGYSSTWGIFNLNGTMTQTGGVCAVDKSLRIANLYSPGTYRLSGTGAVTADTLEVSYGGNGSFFQTGGSVAVTGLYVDSTHMSGAAARYEISDGFISADYIGLTGSNSSFKQSGGIAQVGTLSDSDWGTGEGYVLSGGSIFSTQHIVSTRFQQSGGLNSTSFLHTTSGGAYTFTAGQLQVSGFTNDGKFDASSAPLNLLVPSGIANFGRGTLVGVDTTTITGGSGSVIILPAGSAGSGPFARVSGAGYEHVAGTPLTVQPQKRITGWGDIDDLLVVTPVPLQAYAPSIVQADTGGFINLNNGLQLTADTTVDLGTGTLTIKDGNSQVTNGMLKCGALKFLASNGSIFHQSDDVQVSGRVTVAGTGGTCTYQLDGWSTRLTCSSLTLGSAGGDGTFVLDGIGGWLTATSIIGIGSGSLFDHRSSSSVSCPQVSLDTGTYKLAGTLSDETTVVSLNRAPSLFQQVGGIHQLQQTLDIETNGVYELDAGEVSGATLNPRGGQFLQKGGSSTWKTVSIDGGFSGPTAGLVTLSGGSFSASSLTIGGTKYPGRLELLSAATGVQVSSSLALTSKGSLSAVPASMIVLKGALSNASTSPNNYADLSNLTLVCEGGSAYVRMFEVAGRDLGPVSEGMIANFGLGTLQVGGPDDAGWIKLIDNSDNAPVAPGVEALYVDKLIVGAGSKLDLNGLHLYCGSLSIDPSATVVGGVCQVVPEPATLCLLVPAVLLRRRRR